MACKTKNGCANHLTKANEKTFCWLLKCSNNQHVARNKPALRNSNSLKLCKV